MPRKKSRSRSSRKKKTTGRTPKRVKALLILLALIAVAGIVGVKFFHTTRGKASLMDAGFTGYYAQVQNAMDDALRPVVYELALDGVLKETVKPLIAGGERFLYRDWQIDCPPPCDLVHFNLDLTRAVREAGGVVRSSIEVPPKPGEAGPRLVVHLGSYRYTTHVVTLEPASMARPESRSVQTRPRLAIVIDDFGYSRNGVAESFFSLDVPLTCSVIPALPYTDYAIARAREVGKRVILHIPMEAQDPEEMNSAQEVVLTSMDNDAVASFLERTLAAHPGAAGINNHQGSLATQDQRVMQAIMTVLARHDLFFLDSLTSSKSVAYNAARKQGVPAARNDIFLDADTEDANVVAERLDQVAETARRRGYAIAIGHPKPWTYEALSNNLERLRATGVEFVFVTDLLQ